MKRFITSHLLAAAAVLLIVALCAAGAPLQAWGWSLAALGTGFLLKDKLLRATRALPASASATVVGAVIDLQNSARGEFVAESQLLLSAPAVTTTMAPDTRTFTYSIVHGDQANLGDAADVYPSVIIQTGAGSAGAAAAAKTVRLPANVKRYVGVKIASGASTTDASAVAATLELLF